MARAKPHNWTTEQIQYLKDIVENRSYKEIIHMFNERFDLNLTDKQIVGTMKRHNLKTGRTGHFPKGHIPFNKGMKGVNFGGENGKKTQFKKGQRPQNYRPVGSERVNVDGYIELKVADPNKWRLKHNVIWEQANGPIPPGHCILFLDSNKQNVSLDNLQLITRKQLARLNQHHLISDNPEVTKTGVIIAAIYNKIGERKKEVK